MIKLTLQNDWQPEDDATATFDKWIADENAKIPPDIRESLREFFPHIGMSSDEADLIPASVAQHIVVYSLTYHKYINARKKSTQNVSEINKSLFNQEFLARLQALYVILEFYAAFAKTLQITKRANAFYVKSSSMKIKSGLLDKKVTLPPKTRAEEDLLAFLSEIEKSLRMFENIVPVEIVKYIGHDSYQIPGDTLSTYSAVMDISELPELKKQAEELFSSYGYLQTGRATFAPRYDETKNAQMSMNTEENAFKQEFLARLQALYTLLEFYAAFVETLLIAKRAGSFNIKACSTKVMPGLFDGEIHLRPKTKSEEQMLSTLVEIEKSLRMFENVVPVAVAKYIGYDSYQIPGDSLSAYSAAAEMLELLDLKKQAEELFCMHGYVQTGKSSFAPEAVRND